MGARRSGGRSACAPGSPRRMRRILPGASTNPDIDIIQWQATQEVSENAFSGRLDFKINDNWSSYVRVFHDQADEPRPAGRQRPVLQHHDQPDQCDLQPAGHPGAAARSTSSSSDTTPRRAPRARTPRPASRTSRSACRAHVANAGIAGQGSSLIARPAPAASSGSTAPGTAAARRTTRTR